MKKFILLISIFFLVFSLFAEQPYFLKDWIIPEDFVWGEGKNIPSISELIDLCLIAKNVTKISIIILRRFFLFTIKN